MRTCEDHSNTVVVFQDKRCPLCDAETDKNAAQSDLDTAKDEVSELKSDLKRAESDLEDLRYEVSRLESEAQRS